jgi:predicted TIM-barrel fold metal-dependent hydrolase
MHVVDPSSYPLCPTAQYTPTPHTLSQAIRFYSSIGINNLVFVQPSIYGNDNSCMLSALRELGPNRGRAVVTFDPANIELSTLQEWHAIGVRGVRVNLVSVGKEMGVAELAMTLKQYADVIRPLDWVLQLYVPLKMAVDLQDIVPMLGVKVCLDHFGQPTLPAPSKEAFSKTSDPYDLPGFSSMIELLKQRDTYVKLSAPYRISKHEKYFDLEPMARELLRIAGKTSVVFATDWPHTRFEGLDIRPFIERVIEWCGRDEKLIDRLFRGNAEQLWGVKR